jgi:hypothetical protein
MVEVRYQYELRSSDRIIATGHLSWEHALQVGDEITIGGHRAVVETVAAVLGSSEKRLVVRIRAEHPPNAAADQPTDQPPRLR